MARVSTRIFTSKRSQAVRLPKEVAGLIAVTNNIKEFGRVPGLVLEDWSEA